MAGVITLGTLKGILVAIIVSMVALAQQVSNPPVYVLGRKRGTNAFRPLSPEHQQDDETFPGLLMLRLTGRLFFANAERVADRVRPLIEEARPRVVALDLSGIFDLEYTALKMITEAEVRQREAGITLWLVGLTPEVLALVQRSPLGKALGNERMFFNLEQAVAHYQALSPATG
jgi:MFS superfamily sulfate permease-like transporter